MSSTSASRSSRAPPRRRWPARSCAPRIWAARPSRLLSARRSPMLELQGVVAGYGATTVLRGVDLTVPDGVVVALLGANGAGKTTLLRVASGLLHPSAGRLLVDGEDVSAAAPSSLVRRGV